MRIFGPENWTGRPPVTIVGKKDLMISVQIVADHIGSSFEDREQRRDRRCGHPIHQSASWQLASQWGRHVCELVSDQRLVFGGFAGDLEVHHSPHKSGL